MTAKEKKRPEEQEAANQQPSVPVQPADPAAGNPPTIEEKAEPFSQQQIPIEQQRAKNVAREAEINPIPSESQRYLDQIFAQYDERKRKNERAEKRDRVREAIGGIGDVASEIAKMYHTTKYAPYVAGENLSEKARQRAALAKANRDKNLDQWMHYVLNVAGKKQAAEQAEKTRQANKERYEQQAKLAEDKMKLAEQNTEKKRREAAIKEDNKVYLKQMMAALRNGEYNRDAEIADLKALKAAGLIDDDEYKARVKTLDAAEASYKEERSKIDQNKRDKADGGTGGGSKANNHQYVGFADGSGVWINKNDIAEILTLYDRDDFPEAYKVKDKYGKKPEPKPTKDAMLKAVLHYLSLNRNSTYEDWLRQVEKRPRKAAKQQKQQDDKQGEATPEGKTIRW